jgi:hypothetical protein
VARSSKKVRKTKSSPQSLVVPFGAIIIGIVGIVFVTQAIQGRVSLFSQAARKKAPSPTRTPECTSGQRQCTSRTGVKSCVNGYWQSSESCAGGKVCVVSRFGAPTGCYATLTNCDSLAEGQVIVLGDGSQYICRSKKWVPQ